MADSKEVRPPGKLDVIKALTKALEDCLDKYDLREDTNSQTDLCVLFAAFKVIHARMQATGSSNKDEVLKFKHLEDVLPNIIAQALDPQVRQNQRAVQADSQSGKPGKAPTLDASSTATDQVLSTPATKKTVTLDLTPKPIAGSPSKENRIPYTPSKGSRAQSFYARISGPASKPTSPAKTASPAKPALPKPASPTTLPSPKPASPANPTSPGPALSKPASPKPMLSKKGRASPVKGKKTRNTEDSEHEPVQRKFTRRAYNAEAD